MYSPFCSISCSASFTGISCNNFVDQLLVQLTNAHLELFMAASAAILLARPAPGKFIPIVALINLSVQI